MNERYQLWWIKNPGEFHVCIDEQPTQPSHERELLYATDVKTDFKIAYTACARLCTASGFTTIDVDEDPKEFTTVDNHLVMMMELIDKYDKENCQ